MGVFILARLRGLELTTLGEWSGETYQWYVARQPSGASCACRREVAGRPKVGQVPLDPCSQQIHVFNYLL